MIIKAMFLVSILCLLLPSAVVAETVPHQSFVVEADGPARNCLQCHNGVNAHEAVYCTSNCAFNASHKILMHYPPRGKKALFAPVANLKKLGIKFENGKVTCVSCHNIRNPAKNNLVMDNGGSRLCLSCHITV